MLLGGPVLGTLQESSLVMCQMYQVNTMTPSSPLPSLSEPLFCSFSTSEFFHSNYSVKVEAHSIYPLVAGLFASVHCENGPPWRSHGPPLITQLGITSVARTCLLGSSWAHAMWLALPFVCILPSYSQDCREVFRGAWV